MDRRDFIQSAGVASMTALGAQGGISVIGTGFLGTQHSHTVGKLKAVQGSPDYKLISVCATDAAARSKAESNAAYQGVKWVSEAELLADPSIHLIVVECRVWDAIPLGKKVIAAGKHLHLEKPPGNELGPFKELLEEAQRKKLLLQTGYLWRWHEGVTAAIAGAKNGWLGDVYMVRGTMNSDRGPEERAIEARYKGGGLFELSGHVIDCTVELLGRPKRVQSWLRHDTSISDKLADNNLAVFEYDRALATISQATRMSGANDHRSFEIIGTDGSILVHPESNPPRMRVSMRQARGPYKAGWQDLTLPPQPRFIADFKELARALKTGQPLKHSYDHELLLQETLLRASGEIS